MARESGRSIGAVAAESFALTLWTYYQSEEAEHFATLIREHEQIRMAEMNAFAFGEPKKLDRFAQDWRKRALEITPTDRPETREEVERWANELWLQYERARNRRPVS